MKLFAFTDIHASMSSFRKIEEKLKKQNADLVVCTGDFTIFEQNIKDILEKISKLGEKILILHGNHETEEILEKMCTYFKNITFMHNKILEINGFTFIGHGGGGFSDVYEDFDNFVKKNKQNIKENIVLLTHAPPYNTKLDMILKDHNGSVSYANFIKNNDVILSISGHFHEGFHKHDKLNIARLINPGPDGELIDL